MQKQNCRLPGNFETQLVEQLLGADFKGRDELLAQFRNCKVLTYDDNGSFEIFCVSTDPATLVEQAVPSEGECEDVDGVTVHFLMHVKKNFLKLIEIYKEDNSDIIYLPPPNEIRVLGVM